jgi:magnesium transporter
VVRSWHGTRLKLAWSSVAELGQKQIRLLSDAVAEPLPDASEADRLRVAEELLDRQIVDVEGAKLVRVNDLHFLEVKGTLRLAHVDVGFRGLVRRMGWQRFVDRVVGVVSPGARYLGADALLAWKLIQPLGTVPGKVRLDVAQRQLASLHPADLAEIMEELDRSQRAVLFERLDVETAADALEESSSEVTTQILENVAPERAADILEEMAPDEAADVLGDLPEETQTELLDAMDRPEAKEVRALLGYEPRSAGGLMNPELIQLQGTVTVRQALDEVRRRAEELSVVYELFIVDSNGLLTGLCTLKDLVAASADARLDQLMREAPATVGVETDVSEVADLAAKYHLLSVPVVGEGGALMGAVTVDDILPQVLHGS